MTFQTQTLDEQITAFRLLARSALAEWGIVPSALELAAYTNNAVFRADGYAVRVHRPGYKSLNAIRSERVWLAALAESGLLVPRPVGGVYSGILPGYDGAVHVTLTTWLDGAPRSLDDMREADLVRVGGLAGRLHSAPFAPPADFARPRLDADGLFSADGQYPLRGGESYFDESAWRLIEMATARIRAAMDALNDSDAFGLIHGDLIAKNLLFDGSAVGVVDFDECAYGYRLYDLTPLIWLARGEPARADAVADALWRGYVAENPAAAGWREQLDVMVMARHVAACRWIAGNAHHPDLRGEVGAMIAARMIELKAYLERINS